MSDVLKEAAREALRNKELIENLDYPNALMFQLRICQLAGMLSWVDFGNAVLTLANMLHVEGDKQFFEDYKSSIFKIRKPSGKYSPVTRREIYTTIRQIDYMKVFRASLSLMKRKGLLLHERAVEEIP